MSESRFKPPITISQIEEGVCKYESYLGNIPIEEAQCEDYKCQDTCENFKYEDL